MEKTSTFPQDQEISTTERKYSPITLAVLASVAATLAPQDSDAKAPNNLLQRHAPKTFYTDSKQTFESVGKNRPREFEVTNEKPITFYVSGPAKVTLKLANKTHQHVQRPIKAKVLVDGTEYQLGHPTKEIALDIGPIALSTGSHEVTVTTDEAHEYYVSLSGAEEGETPEVLDAYQMEWIDDPNTPGSFQVLCHAHEDTDSEAKAGLDFRFLTDTPPVELKKDKKGKGFTYKITRLPESEEITVTLEDKDTDGVTYTSASFQPDEDQTCDFERTVPPAESQDYTAPEQIALNITPASDVGTGDVKLVPPAATQEDGLALPSGMECKVINSQSEIPKTSRLFCWQRVKGLIQAWRAMITSKTPATETAQKFRYILKKY